MSKRAKSVSRRVCKEKKKLGKTLILDGETYLPKDSADIPLLKYFRTSNPKVFD